MNKYQVQVCFVLYEVDGNAPSRWDGGTGLRDTSRYAACLPGPDPRAQAESLERPNRLPAALAAARSTVTPLRSTAELLPAHCGVRLSQALSRLSGSITTADLTQPTVIHGLVSTGNKRDFRSCTQECSVFAASAPYILCRA